MTACDYIPWIGVGLVWFAVGWICGAACRD